ncbi:hypothetical protein ACG7TL_005910 [Trametes sanguinea]
MHSISYYAKQGMMRRQLAEGLLLYRNQPRSSSSGAFVHARASPWLPGATAYKFRSVGVMFAAIHPQKLTMDLTFGLEFEAIVVRFKPPGPPPPPIHQREQLARIIQHVKRAYLQRAGRTAPQVLAEAFTASPQEGRITPNYSLWNVVPDPTIRLTSQSDTPIPGLTEHSFGVEVVTPIFHVASGEEWKDELRAVLRGVAEYVEWTTNHSTGLHMHIGRQHNGYNVGFTLSELKRIAMLVCRFEDLRALLRTINYVRREGSGSDKDDAYNGYQDSKYFKVTTSSHSTPDAVALVTDARNEIAQKFKTVEFRQHEGTVSATVTIEWAEFILRFVNFAIYSHPDQLKAGGRNGTIQELHHLFVLPRLFQERLRRKHIQI